MSELTFTPGDRVVDQVTGRWGTVKSVDWGGVYVELDATDEQGRELRICRTLDLRGGSGNA